MKNGLPLFWPVHQSAWHSFISDTGALFGGCSGYTSCGMDSGSGFETPPIKWSFSLYRWHFHLEFPTGTNAVLVAEVLHVALNEDQFKISSWSSVVWIGLVCFFSNPTLSLGLHLQILRSAITYRSLCVLCPCSRDGSNLVWLSQNVNSL